jgi:hypothetical protein
VNTRGFSRPQDRPQIVWIFDPIKKDEEGRLAPGLRSIKNLLRRVVGFRGDQGDHALMVPARRKTVERLRRLDMDRNSLRLRKLDKVMELPIGAEDKKPLQRTRTCTQGLTHSMQPVNQVRRTIASTGWCRQACPR